MAVIWKCSLNLTRQGGHYQPGDKRSGVMHGFTLEYTESHIGGVVHGGGPF